MVLLHLSNLRTDNHHPHLCVCVCVVRRWPRQQQQWRRKEVVRGIGGGVGYQRQHSKRMSGLISPNLLSQILTPPSLPYKKGPPHPHPYTYIHKSCSLNCSFSINKESTWICSLHFVTQSCFFFILVYIIYNNIAHPYMVICSFNYKPILSLSHKHYFLRLLFLLRLQQYRLVEMKLLAQHRNLQVPL